MKTNFDAWMQKVDDEINALSGMSRDDLADCCYREWYDDGVTPARAARRAIKNANE